MSTIVASFYCVSLSTHIVMKSVIYCDTLLTLSPVLSCPVGRAAGVQRSRGGACVCGGLARQLVLVEQLRGQLQDLM